MRYHAAFNAARAEIDAAIQDAAAAERVTASAVQEHNDSERRARLAEPGTSASIVAAFSDPGAPGLALAQSRANAALAAFNRTGDEVAAEIRTAAGKASGEKSGIDIWDQILEGPGRFVEGFLLQLSDTVIGLWELLPFPYMLDNVFNHEGKPWWEQYGDFWGGIVDALVNHPEEIIPSFFKSFFAVDHWDEYAGEGLGRVGANVLLFFASGVGLLKTIRKLRDIKRPGVVGGVLRDGSHFNPDGTLKPNAKYQTGEFEYIYTTDANGHISRFQTDDLKLTDRMNRLKHDPNTPGKLPGDHAGHVVADVFGGSPEIDNLVSQLSKVNQSTYRRVEIQWQKALDPNQPGGPKKVSVDLKIQTDPKTGRPTRFDLEYAIDGKISNIEISNL